MYENLGVDTKFLSLAKLYQNILVITVLHGCVSGHLGFMLIKHFPQSCCSGKRWIWAQYASIFPNIPKNLIVLNISGLTRVITSVGYWTIRHDRGVYPIQPRLTMETPT